MLYYLETAPVFDLNNAFPIINAILIYYRVHSDYFCILYIYIYVSPISQTGFTMPATTAEGQPAAVDGVAISNSVDIVDDTVDNWRRSRRQARYRVSVFVWSFFIW